MHPEAMRVLMRHHWPGNIRELENVVERAVLLAEGGCIGKDDLQIADPSRRLDASHRSTVVTIPPTGIPLEEIERQAIIEALRMSNWTQKEAAEILGISPRVINYKIQNLKIVVPSNRRSATAGTDEVSSGGHGRSDEAQPGRSPWLQADRRPVATGEASATSPAAPA